MLMMIKNMWNYRNGCPKCKEKMEENESINFSNLDVRLQKVYEDAYKGMTIVDEKCFHISFDIRKLRQLMNLVINNNIRDCLGEGWKLTAVNKTLNEELNIWYRRD